MAEVYHDGERQVQQRVGVRAAADRVGEIIAPNLPLGIEYFFGRQTFLVIGAVSDAGCIWASILTGPRGFIQVPDLNTVAVNALPAAGDPLGACLQPASPIAALAIDLAQRWRFRFNGQVHSTDDRSFRVTVAESYTNCKKYIQPRQVASLDETPSAKPHITTVISESQRHWIQRSDTFFIASAYQDKADVSHRGGKPGFVVVDDHGSLTWADYVGNNMFQTLGNLTVNPRCGLVFMDFEAGNMLQLTGHATINDSPDRAVTFIPEHVAQTDHATILRWSKIEASP